MTIREIEERKAAIAVEMEQDGANLDALTEEVRKLNDEKAEIEKREKLRAAVASGDGTVTRSFGVAPEMTYGVETEEYRTAWLKSLRGNELSDIERRAMTAANGAISKAAADDILAAVIDLAPLLNKITLVRAGAAITYYVETELVKAGDHTENGAITADDGGLTPVQLTPAEIVKMVQVSDAAQQMSVGAFGKWLTDSLAKSVAAKINEKIVSAISADATSAGATINTAGVQAMLGAVPNANGKAVVIVNRKTFFTKLLPLQDNDKSAIVRFEGGEASIYGVPVMIDNNVTDDVVYAGNADFVVGALAEDINVRTAYDINTNSNKYLGVALFDVKAPIKFVKLGA